MNDLKFTALISWHVCSQVLFYPPDRPLLRQYALQNGQQESFYITFFRQLFPAATKYIEAQFTDISIKVNEHCHFGILNLRYQYFQINRGLRLLNILSDALARMTSPHALRLLVHVHNPVCFRYHVFIVLQHTITRCSNITRYLQCVRLAFFVNAADVNN